MYKTTGNTRDFNFFLIDNKIPFLIIFFVPKKKSKQNKNKNKKGAHVLCGRLFLSQ